MQDYRRKEQRISLIAGMILIAVTVVAGAAVFLVMQRHAESLLSKSLLLSLQNRAEQVQFDIDEHVLAARTIGSRPFIMQQMIMLSANPEAASARAALMRAASSFLPTGFSSIAFYDSKRVQLAHAGEEISDPELDIKLASPDDARLLWKDGLVLRMSTPMVDAGRVIGTVVTESSLRRLNSVLFRVGDLGQTGDVALCAPLAGDDMHMQCFPSTLTQHVFLRQPRRVNGSALPMSHALDGSSGVLITHDYRRRQVVAAYGPVPGLGLGLVLKVDTAELYVPVWRLVPYIVALLSLVVFAGVVLLRWLVVPLVAHVVQSEQETRDVLEKLSEGEMRIRAVLNNIDEGIVTFAPDGVIESFNPAAERMFGYGSEEMIGRHIDTLMPDHLRIVQAGSEFEQGASATTAPGNSHGREMTALRRDGTTFPVGVRVSHMRIGEQRRYVDALHDLTLRKENENKILHLATHDSLTGLPNRMLLQDRIQQAIARAQRHPGLLAVMFVDLDNFKTINDSLGHDIGDSLLKSVAERIARCIRDEDTVARQGGDEFIVVLDELNDPKDAADIAKKILDALGKPYSIGERELHTGASIGIAVYPMDGQRVDELLKNSDTAMYHAKDAGRNNFQFFAPQMNARAAERLMLENSLRHALDRGEMLLHYQPIVSIGDNTVLSAEALLRWRHPALGLISPAKFVPIAENAGFIIRLGEWVLQSACEQFMAWRRSGMDIGRMTVNVSPRQFRQEHLVESFARILNAAGMDPGCLGLEITESVIMENPETSIAVLGRLKDMGIELSLDDFGTGYSSLSYLKRFPINKLKIDQSFVRDIAVDPDDEALVAAIISMAHSLGVRVVAEGVETPHQLAFIRQHGCDEYQGYHFSRPVPAHQFPALLAELKLSAAGGDGAAGG